jgi:hypothetical protein
MRHDKMDTMRLVSSNWRYESVSHRAADKFVDALWWHAPIFPVVLAQSYLIPTRLLPGVSVHH